MFDVFYTGPKPNLFAFEQPAANINDAAIKCRTEYCWFIDGHNDYSNFDFGWRPVPWEKDHTHVWPSQWQDCGGTYLIPKGVTEHQWHWRCSINDGYVPRNKPTDIFYMDFMNPGSKEQLDMLREKYPNVKSTRYVSDHLNVLRRIVNLATTEYVWVISSVCSYTDFDFTWHPKQWQEEMIHCFPSGTQKRGDTFYIHVESFKRQMVELELLDWFNVINYCEDQIVYRYVCPQVYYNHDNLVEEIRSYDFKFPYAAFTNNDSLIFGADICLWTEKDRSVQSFTKSNAVCIVPRDIKAHLKTQIYDYPYIERSNDIFETEKPEVIFISNGEPMADANWLALSKICPWAKRSDGVTGREAAYKAAARLSNTPWFYAVFAKTEVLPSFKFDFVPDYFQEPKHYIFHSRNPLNGLEYGAMNINLYNKKLVLETEPGLDFTLSKAHAVIPECISISRFNTDPWITWRSAFRETMKLQREVDLGAGVEIRHRLNVWCTRANGENAEYCIQGALDGVEYYKSVNGDYDALKLSFDWAWCQDYYYKKYNRKIWLESVQEVLI